MYTYYRKSDKNAASCATCVIVEERNDFVQATTAFHDVSVAE